MDAASAGRLGHNRPAADAHAARPVLQANVTGIVYLAEEEGNIADVWAVQRTVLPEGQLSSMLSLTDA